MTIENALNNLRGFINHLNNEPLTSNVQTNDNIVHRVQSRRGNTNNIEALGFGAAQEIENFTEQTPCTSQKNDMTRGYSSETNGTEGRTGLDLIGFMFLYHSDITSTQLADFFGLVKQLHAEPNKTVLCFSHFGKARTMRNGGPFHQQSVATQFQSFYTLYKLINIFDKKDMQIEEFDLLSNDLDFYNMVNIICTKHNENSLFENFMADLLANEDQKYIELMEGHDFRLNKKSLYDVKNHIRQLLVGLIDKYDQAELPPNVSPQTLGVLNNELVLLPNNMNAVYKNFVNVESFFE